MAENLSPEAPFQGLALSSGENLPAGLSPSSLGLVSVPWSVHWDFWEVDSHVFLQCLYFMWLHTSG